MITLTYPSTNQKIILNERDSKVFHDEMLKVQLTEGSKIDIGLLASNITIELIINNNITKYYLYDRGYLLSKENSNTYFMFEYGNIFYQKFEQELKEILSKNPKHFFNI